LVSAIPAGNGIIVNHFVQCRIYTEAKGSTIQTINCSAFVAGQMYGSSFPNINVPVLIALLAAKEIVCYSFTTVPMTSGALLPSFLINYWFAILKWFAYVPLLT
jgi:hypothetical protein